MNRLEVDRAVFYLLLNRGWQFVAGAVSTLLFAECFTEAELGFYGMFASLMGMHMLVELGLTGVVAAVASHEWALLGRSEDGRITGDVQAHHKLAALFRWTHRWYSALAIISTIVVGLGGYWFLSRSGNTEVDWRTPWWCYVVLNGPVVALWARAAILEGCNEVRTINRIRLIQAVCGNLVVWPAIFLGWGLWAAVASAAVRLAWDLWLTQVHYRPFFRDLNSPTTTADFSWRGELWPLQWRVAIRSLALFFALQIFTPVLFEYRGEAEAGRFWLTWSALTAIEGAAFAWVQTRAPLLGMLIARRDFVELDRVFFRVGMISCLMLLLAGSLLCAVIALLPLIPMSIATKLSERLLAWETVAVFVVGMLGYNAVRCFGLYVFSHKRDPFLLSQLVACGLMSAAVWYGGKTYGAIGLASGYAVATNLVFLPLWWRQWRLCRQRWQLAESAQSSAVRPV